MPIHKFATRTLVAFVLFLGVAAPAVLAQPPQSDPRSSVAHVQPPAPPEGFVPASSLPSQEQLPAAPLVIGAYAIAWVAVFAYLWSIWQRLSRVERDLADVSRRIATGERP